ncbi:matrixin family metalloprotease [Moraxella bovis]|uniref:M10 family metallopeptidase domain-containing protein n=1 Tax=Moraxella bovis TaxID=476 RepID=UPI0022273C4C|nr:M10 family metallopeptidase domain-containing protein [Moraxella bovis]UYZ80217.1 matrixin family metalloprotease [Moraxella bovis]UYZ90401.1 matrixin family metalloprotease [Moraxella bovis]UYZ94415.1 matrixin family metalloprotease [Moraxella bovis]UZA25397.1 matrixin family metalloprotease [Moraxella bovis]UZA29113.1 matrixin family metalloprotease [Moraxella bovis]
MTLLKIIRLMILAGVVLVLGFFSYQTHTEPQVRYNSLIHRLTYPTDLRVRYRIGDVDERFGLSRDEVKRLAHQAVMIWHDGTGRQWFVYDDSAKVSINLIYDERQMETTARQQIKQELDTLQQNHKRDSDNLARQRQALHDEFYHLQTELTAWQEQYNQIIHLINHTRDPNERQRLLGIEKQLRANQQALNAKIDAYQLSQDAFNQAVDDINHKAGHINHAIDHANARLTPREFHKGQFDGHKIDIYEFENIDDLRLVLAHELGHALSIGHNDDPTALMYPYANEQDLHNFELKQADIDLLNERTLYR